MLGRAFEKRLIQDPRWNQWAADGDNSPLLAQRRVTENTALGLLAVYSAVQTIVSAISTLPVDIFRGDGPTREKVKNPPRWTIRPNTAMSLTQFIGQLLFSLLLRGNAYVLIVRDRFGQPLELWPLHPDWVRVTRGSFGGTSVREYEVLGRPIASSEILHVTGMMPPGGIVGVDPITAAQDALGGAADAQMYGGRFFQNSAIPAGVIRVPNPMSSATAKELRDQWRSMHGGPNRVGLPAVLSGGAEYQPITITNEQAQFLETRRYSDEQIYHLFGLGNPLHTDQGNRITYANTEQVSADIARYALVPRTSVLEEAFTSLLPRPQEWRFDFDVFLRADTQARYQAYGIGINNGFLMPDEVRAKEDLPPRDDLPEPQTNFTPTTPPVPPDNSESDNAS